MYPNDNQHPHPFPATPAPVPPKPKGKAGKVIGGLAAALVGVVAIGAIASKADDKPAHQAEVNAPASISLDTAKASPTTTTEAKAEGISLRDIRLIHGNHTANVGKTITVYGKVYNTLTASGSTNLSVSLGTSAKNASSGPDVIVMSPPADLVEGDRFKADVTFTGLDGETSGINEFMKEKPVVTVANVHVVSNDGDDQ